MWPTFEWFSPPIPFFEMLSIGVLMVVGMIGALVGLNAAILAKFAILAVGPSAAAPFYWVLVDLDSPVGILFHVVSIALLMASLLSTMGTIAESPACALEENDTSRGVHYQRLRGSTEPLWVISGVIHSTLADHNDRSIENVVEEGVQRAKRL